MRYFAVLFVLCPAALFAAEPPAGTIPAIAFGRPWHLEDGQIRLLAFCHKNVWIENSFTPKEILKFQDERLYEELASSHAFVIHVFPIRHNTSPEEIAALEHDALATPHKDFFQYSPEQYKGIQTLKACVFKAINAPDVTFKIKNLIAVSPVCDADGIALVGSLDGPKDSVATFEEAIAAEDKMIDDTMEADSYRIFVTAGPANAVIEPVENIPGLQSWIEKGKNRVIEIHQEQHRENLKDVENWDIKSERELKTLTFQMVAIKAKSSIDTSCVPTEEELNEIKDICLKINMDPPVVISYLRAIKQAYPEVKDMANSDLLMKTLTETLQGDLLKYANDNEGALKYLQDKINACKKEMEKEITDKQEYMSILKKGAGIDPALYEVKILFKRIALPGIFSGIWLHANYIYPKDKLPPHTPTFSGNYMALINTSRYSEDSIVWEQSSDYDRTVDCSSGIEYEFEGICDANEDEAPEILLSYGGHEFSGIEMHEFSNGKMRLVSDFSRSI